MASTYTDNTGIEKPGAGEQSGTWGTTTNSNFDIIDRSLNGVGAITLSGTTHTLTTSDGSTSDGHYRVLVLGGTPSGTNTITISPNDQDKVYLVYNNSGETAIFSQGSGANATIANGKTAWIYADGAGSGAAVRAVPADMVDDTTPQLGGNLDVNGNSIVSVSNGDIAITPDGTGDVIIDGIKYPQTDGSADEFLKTDGSGQLSFGSVSASAFNAGMLMPYAGATAPTGWLLCFGQAVSRSTYATLFGVVGTTYGAGDGSTTFNLPDLRGRTIAGKDDMGGTSANRLTNQTGGLDGDGLGNVGGAETHALAEAELAAHRHKLLSTTTQGGTEYGDSGGANDQKSIARKNSYNNVIAYSLGYVTDSSEPTIAPSAETGSGTAHNNVQPTIILTYIIKT